MSARRRAAIPILLVVGVVGASVALSGGLGLGSAAGERPGPGPSGGAGAGGFLGGPDPTPRPPLGATELYGYLPYWQMTDAVARHLRSSPVTTLALFSVTARRSGELNSNPIGYRRITGDIGRRLIREAHDRDARVELVFSSFGATRNGRLFGRLDSPGPIVSGPPGASPNPVASAPWRRTVVELVDLATNLGVDGINVDIERLDLRDRPAFAEFLATLRASLRREIPGAQVSVATEAGERGVGNAAAATGAGADRVFLMGYDYHWSGSSPGASAPVDRVDGNSTLRRSIIRYVEAGIPRDRILLGLPLYGMTWRTLGPDRFGLVTGAGVPWLPRENVAKIEDPAFLPTRDAVELAEWFAEPDGDEWLVTFYDSPGTLRPKLGLARDQGLAGAGFWALGYDRGVSGYADLMADFAGGDVSRAEAPRPR